MDQYILQEAPLKAKKFFVLNAILLLKVIKEPK